MTEFLVVFLKYYLTFTCHMLETLNHKDFYYALYRSLKLWVHFILVLLYFTSLECTVKNMLFSFCYLCFY